MTVIELGELSRDGGPPPPAPPLRLDRRLIRRVAVAVVAVLTVLGVTGSTPAVRHNIRPLWSTSYGEGDSMTLDGTTLYATQQEKGPATVSAYDLATGRRRWSVPIDDPNTGLPPAVAGTLVMAGAMTFQSVPQPDGTFMVQAAPDSTIARDAATGRTLWTVRGDALQSSPGSVLLGENDHNGSLTRLRVVGLRDGTTRWTKAVHGFDVWTVAESGGQPSGIVLAGPSGDVTVLDYARGTTLRTGKIALHDPQPNAKGYFASLDVAGGLLVVSRSEAERNDSTVYRLDTFRELWHSNGFVADCGVVFCAMDETGLTGRDPATGQVRWRRPDLGGLWPLANGRLLGNGASAMGPYQMIDPATGRGFGDVIRGEPTWTEGTPGGSVLLMGTVVDDYKLSSVIQLDLDTGASYLLGAVRGAAHFGCQSVPGYLVCARSDGLDVTAVG
jgi:hypothetical protein